MNLNESAKLTAAVEMMAEALLPLSEEIRESFIKNLHTFLRPGGIKLTETTDGPTPGTRRGCISIEFLGVDEFIAAARRASDL